MKNVNEKRSDITTFSTSSAATPSWWTYFLPLSLSLSLSLSFLGGPGCLNVKHSIIGTPSLFAKKCFVPSLVEISPVVQDKKIFNFSSMYFCLEKGVAVRLNKFEVPLPKDALCQVWLKLAQYFKYCHVFLLFHNYLHWEWVWPFILKNWIRFTQGCFVSSLV